MLGAASAAANFWYIETLSNGTLASFSKRSIPENAVPEKRENSLAKRTIIFPLAALQPLIDAFQEYFGLNISQAAFATFPNPFSGIKSKNIVVADGSEGGQSIPLWPQIQPARKPSFILAWDDDGDANPYSWNNGTNLYDTYLQAKAGGIPFPVVPPQRHSSTTTTRRSQCFLVATPASRPPSPQTPQSSTTWPPRRIPHTRTSPSSNFQQALAR